MWHNFCSSFCQEGSAHSAVRGSMWQARLSVTAIEHRGKRLQEPESHRPNSCRTNWVFARATKGPDHTKFGGPRALEKCTAIAKNQRTPAINPNLVDMVPGWPARVDIDMTFGVCFPKRFPTPALLATKKHSDGNLRWKPLQNAAATK
jgi:hypothetical protein